MLQPVTGGAKPKPTPVPVPVAPPSPVPAPAPAPVPMPVTTPMQALALGQSYDVGGNQVAVPDHPVAAPAPPVPPIPPVQPGPYIGTAAPGTMGQDGSATPGQLDPGAAFRPPPPPGPEAPHPGPYIGTVPIGTFGQDGSATPGQIDPGAAFRPPGTKPPGDGGTDTPASAPGGDGTTTDAQNAGATSGGATPGGSTPSGATTAPDLTIDPVYQQQKALDEALLQKSASGYLSSAKDLLQGYGSQTLGKQVLDQLMADPRIAALMTPADEAAFLATLSDNPDTSVSTQAQLARKFRAEELALDQGYNGQNLFYSGARARGLGDQSYSEQTRTGAAKDALMNALSKAAAAWSTAQTQAAQGDLTGYQDAYNRALQEALQFDTGAGADTTVSGPADTSAAAAPATTTAAPTAPKAPAAPKAKAPVKVAVSAPAAALAARSAALNAAYGLDTKKKKKPAVGAYAGRH